MARPAHLSRLTLTLTLSRRGRGERFLAVLLRAYPALVSVLWASLVPPLNLPLKREG